jgi:hypothetical protein
MVRFGAIQVNQMKPFNASILKHFGNLERIFVVNGFLRIVALRKPDAFTINNVYGGNDFYHAIVFVWQK